MEEDDRPPSSLSSGAEELVSAVLERARRHVVAAETEPNAPAGTGEEEEEAAATKNIAWATCGDFTVDLGKRQIEEYVRTCWGEEVGGPGSGWLSSFVYLRTSEPDEHRSLHHYRLRWSVPTRRAPVPEATACVHFVAEVSRRARARDVPVEVRFQVESNRLVHTAGRSRFREKWLRDVIESKALVRAAVDF